MYANVASTGERTSASSLNRPTAPPLRRVHPPVTTPAAGGSRQQLHQPLPTPDHAAAPQPPSRQPDSDEPWKMVGELGPPGRPVVGDVVAPQVGLVADALLAEQAVEGLGRLERPGGVRAGWPRSPWGC